MDHTETYDALIKRIKILSEKLWEGHCTEPDVKQWLENFNGRHCGDADVERLHALHLLSAVSYFGLRELRVLLRSMYRDAYRYPIVQQIRQSLGGTRDVATIQSVYQEELDATRFVGMGSPAESGTHLLYYFRQESGLSKTYFVSPYDLLGGAASSPNTRLANQALRRIVFIDDLCGSGHQAVAYSGGILQDLQAVAGRGGTHLEFQYLVLFGTTAGLEYARDNSAFNYVRAVCEIDDTYLTFGAKSRVFRKAPAELSLTQSERMARGYGGELQPGSPLGFGDAQLLLAFHHNVPDNSLPILWYNEGAPPWKPAFARNAKIY